MFPCLANRPETADEKANRRPTKKAANPRGRRPRSRLDLEYLLLDLIYAIAGFRLRGLDLQAMLPGGGREETPDRVGLPIGGLLGVDKQMHLGRRVSPYVSA